MKFSEHFIKAYDGPLKGLISPMVDQSMYTFKI